VLIKLTKRKFRLSYLKNRLVLLAGYISLGILLGWLLSATSHRLIASDKINVQPLSTDQNLVAQVSQNAANLYAVSPDILAIAVAAPAVTLGQQRPYVAQATDFLVVEETQTIVERAGKAIGVLVGDDQKTLYSYDQVQSTGLDIAAAESASSYAISSASDTSYAQPTQPTQVFRKTQPVAFANRGPEGYSWPSAHTLFLKLPRPLQPAQPYQISLAGLGLENAGFTYQPTSTRSEAVHVSLLGFRPDDPLKVGYLSMWMGSGGSLDYADNLAFQLVDTQGDQVVYRGTATLTHSPNQAEDPKGRDYTLSEVHRLDFSAFNRPGEYRLCVDGVGCSLDFEIAPDTWQKAFFTAVRGFYHQRSGVAIGPPYSEYTRPRAFHPDDDVEIYQAGVTLLDSDMGLGDRPTFAALRAQSSQEILPNAWGGYFDAGDWDRRIQHLSVPRGLLELHNLFPDYFKSLKLNLPESDNSLPDILDEALWSLDFFRRLQTSEGGIRGGIESTEHPKFGEASWQESLQINAYAPDVWSSYSYAGVAARAAFTLKASDQQLADTYQSSALRAMAYAEKHYSEADATGGELKHHVKDQRNLAALELYRLTRDRQWHNLFLTTSVFQDPQAEASIYGSHEQRDAAFLYAKLNSRLDRLAPITDAQALPVDERVQLNARAALLRYADSLVALTQTTAFGWSKDHPDAPIGWGNGLGAPKSVNLLQAHALTQDAKYLQAAIGSTQFSGGANPANRVYTTGISDRSPQNPLIIDQRITAQSPPPGITVYGPADFSVYSDYWTLPLIADSTFPAPQAWPTAENYFDIYLHPISTEFTVDYMLSPAYTWGYLAARQG
jgi:endoglucanase